MNVLSYLSELRSVLGHARLTRMSAGLTVVALVSLGSLPRALAASPEEIKARKPVPELNVKGGAAVKGYDAVAYFADGKPVKGSPEFSYKWKDANWQFASAEHRAAFMKEPTKYAPKYGGYCSYAVSQGSIVDIDPNQWNIVGGKLYLNANSFAQAIWRRDPEGHIKKGDVNWPLFPRRPL